MHFHTGCGFELHNHGIASTMLYQPSYMAVFELLSTQEMMAWESLALFMIGNVGLEPKS